MSEYGNDDQGQDIPALREAAKRGDAAQKRADEAERRLALVEAGVDTKSPVGKLFTEAYKGALTEDAIKEAWAELAPASAAAPAPAADPEPQPPTSGAADLEETEARRLLTSAGAGDHVNEKPPVDPIAVGYEEFHERLGKGETRIKAAGSVFGALLGEAAAGNEKAVWTGWTQEEIEAGRG